MALGHFKILTFGHLGTFALGHFSTWALEHLGTWALNHMPIKHYESDFFALFLVEGIQVVLNSVSSFRNFFAQRCPNSPLKIFVARQRECFGDEFLNETPADTKRMPV